MKQFKRLVFPGRFQPPHEGHVYAVKYALGLADEVIIVIGSAQDSHSLKNPLTAGERWVLLEKLFRLRLSKDEYDRLKIAPVMDINMNKVWVQYLKLLLPEFDGVVSGNPLVLMLFEDMGLVAIKQPLKDREYCSGTEIRKKVLKGENWESCVPEEIRGDLIKMGFVERLRRLAEDG